MRGASSRRRWAAAAVVVALAGCGGGGDSGATEDEAGGRGQRQRQDQDDDRSPGDCPPATSATAAQETTAAPLEEVTEAAGLVDPLLGMFGHAAATADVDGDGDLDLFVGTFADKPEDRYRQRGADGPSPDRLLLGGPDGFQPAAGFDLGPGRTSGGVFADLDGDDDPDLVAVRNGTDRGDGPAAGAPTILAENDGNGGFAGAVELLPGVRARGVGVLDIDGDARLDLFLSTEPGADTGSVLLRNEGDFRFTDVTADAGVPADVHGLAVVAADLDGDGATDLLVPGEPRVLRGDGTGGFDVVEVATLAWDTYGREDLVAGADVGDLDGDGRPDLVVGHHFNSTADRGCLVPVRVYRNTGEPGSIGFEDVTVAAGLPGLSTKAPHVELADLDDDGRLDLVTTASAASGDAPAVFANVGGDGEIAFAAPEGLGGDHYWVTGATGDFDGDGRLDVFAVENDPALPSRLWHNAASTNGAVEVEVGLGATGVGAIVEVYEPGRLGDQEALVARRQVVVGRGYAAGGPGLVHVGIGDRAAVDVLVRTASGAAQEHRSVEAGVRVVR